MVTRKPVPLNSSASGGAPYPTTPVTSHLPPGYTGRLEEEDDAQNAWSSEGLHTSQTPSADNGGRAPDEVPQSLRVGPPGYTPRSSSEMERPSQNTTNPYLRHQQTGQRNSSGDGKESSASAWGGFAERPPVPLTAPPPPPVPKDTLPAPVGDFANLSISESSTNPWQPSLDAKPLPQNSVLPTIRKEDSGNEAWSSIPDREASPPPSGADSPALIAMDSEPTSPAWDEDEPSPIIPDRPLDIQPAAEENAWEDGEAERKAQDAAVAQQRVAVEESLRREDGWEDVQQQSGVIDGDIILPERAPALPVRSAPEELAPALPPRTPHEDPPLQPPRPIGASHNRSDSSLTGPSTPGTAAKKQKKETYEIKKITWHDATAKSNPRTSPILVQNANGPCPLLGLVNALTLSTPADFTTALVETLRTRERVSLGLLLDAVFDELMSGRRGDGAQELPDVGDLYSFLVTLHTGMNVNPRFVAPAPTNLMDDPRRSMSHVHPSEREDSIAGSFEETREMKLYSTFSIPLIHGWLPSRDSPEYTALARSAKTYEDAQNLMFREEELEDKLQREGLSFEEQGTLEDIATIKAFFVTAATQLTPYGLDTIQKSLAPGAVAILFRNDHFSTLYKHPGSHQLLHLVTDMGYAGHEEVVWESLTDINGEHCEFFSGDFRLVGGAPSQGHDNSGSGWTTVSRRNNTTSSASGSAPPRPQQSINATLATNTSANDSSGQYSPIQSPTTEQEDHDLALALQLQDEEEQRHREEQARRRHESELSQQFIEQQAATPSAAQAIPVSQRGGRGRGSRNPSQDLRPIIPPRRNNTGTSSSAPAAPTDPEAGIDAPPPSYEQAAGQSAYNPPANHPAHPSASPNSSTAEFAPPTGRRRSSAYASASSQFSGRRGGAGRGVLVEGAQNGRRPQGQGQAQDEKCVVM